ncbi:hypothetical protein [Polyangium mundeleinium]|uniref:ParB/Sulfiredoxin domain-containing protein n=1 Tax=Polyangium mundeleinium TaxID=2995306 RepID=A0ABT5FA07_9BACT|nr:hypothetical protein [Polyangium mundeleinium]MDC0749950.1 hypothetical protein [Polyangium mundeleinium]
MAEPISSRTTNTAERSVMMHAPAPAARCATCGTPGVRTEALDCGVCDELFILGGQLVVSLDGLDEELAAGGLYCESCGERRPPFEHLACTGCSAPARHIGDVLAHNRRGQGRCAADAVADAPVELPDDGITTDPEIEALLPRESNEEYALLEQDLRAHGCVAPLVVWQDGPRQVLLDGHTRRAICRTRRIFYEKKILEFPDRTSAILWVIENQLGRRNLTPEAQAYLRGRIYNLEKRQGARTDLDTSRQGGEKLSERLADVYKVGSRTIERDGRFAAHLDDLAAVYGAAIKNAVLARDAKMTRAEVAKAVGLDALTQARVVARVQQGEAAIDVICEALRDRGLNDRLSRRAHAAEAEEDAGDAEASTSSGEPHGHADASPGHSGAGGLLSQGEELVIPPAVPQGFMMPIDPAGARRLPASRAEDLASTDEVEIDDQELASIPRALADARDKLKRSKPGRMNADLVSTVRKFLTQIDRELRLHEEAATGSG